MENKEVLQALLDQIPIILIYLNSVIFFKSLFAINFKRFQITKKLQHQSFQPFQF